MELSLKNDTYLFRKKKKKNLEIYHDDAYHFEPLSSYTLNECIKLGTLGDILLIVIITIFIFIPITIAALLCESNMC